MNISNKVISHFKDQEGYVNHFYLDTKGIVTIGIGCVLTLQQALALPFLNRNTLVNATTAEIKADFDLVSGLEKGKPANYYFPGLHCYLPENVIYDLFGERIKVFVKGLTAILNDFESYSESLKLVLLDMAFSLGISGLAFKFPKFCLAVRESNSEAAATESIRVDVQQTRNEWAFRILSEQETWHRV